jgi:hypothetical protein
MKRYVVLALFVFISSCPRIPEYKPANMLFMPQIRSIIAIADALPQHPSFEELASQQLKKQSPPAAAAATSTEAGATTAADKWLGAVKKKISDITNSQVFKAAF